MIVYLRLAIGTAVVLAPGAAVARALGQRTRAATLAWALAALFVAWAVVFTVHGSIRLARRARCWCWSGWLRASAARFGREPAFAEASPARGVRAASVWLGGVVLGWLLWHVEGPVTGDGPFHEARVRKLVALGNLHLRTVDEFKDGGLHPGYAFPLWHGFLALVAWVSHARSRDGGPARAVAARAARLRPRLGVGCRALRLGVGGLVGALRLARGLLLRPRARRLVRHARPAGHDRPAAARAGRARALLRLDRDALARGARRHGGDLRRARAGPSDVRALPAPAARRLRAPAAARVAAVPRRPRRRARAGRRWPSSG